MAREDGLYRIQECRSGFVVTEEGSDDREEAIVIAKRWKASPINEGDAVRVIADGEFVWPRLSIFTVRWDSTKFAGKWTRDKVRLFGERNEGVEVEAEDAASAIKIFAAKHNLNSFYLTTDPRR